MNFTLQKTKKHPYGAYRTKTGIRISTEVNPAETCGIVLFNENELSPTKIVFPKWAINGRIASVEIVFDSETYKSVVCKDGRGIKYLFFSGDDFYPDPYMHDGDGFGPFGQVGSPVSRIDLDSISQSTKELDTNVQSRLTKNIYYMLHVRGYTAHKSSKTKYAGTFRGLLNKLDYINELGITSLILMPVYEFNEIISTPNILTNSEKEDVRVNFWGYSEGFYYKPKHSYSSNGDPVSEFEQLVNAIHEKSMEVILQFWFPDSYSCRQITDILRFWRERYSIDGFQLIGANSCIDEICMDPELYDCKILSDVSISRGDDKYNNKHYFTEPSSMVDLRKFLKGDPNSAFNAAMHLKTSDSISRPVSFIARQDTMRAVDIVTYNEKHNDSNGENGRDGADYNYSWNCGIEGETRKKNIVELRRRQYKNALALVLLGQADPLIFGGDEFGNTQYGNNNPYNQDNETGYVKWPTTAFSKDILEFARGLIEFRKNTPVLGSGLTLSGRDFLSLGFPDVSLHGEELWRADLGPTSHCFGILYYNKYADAKDDSLVYLLFNMHWETQKIALPVLKKGKWSIRLTNDNSNICSEEKTISIAPRSIIVLEGK